MVRRQSSGSRDILRLQNVGVHFPERLTEATGDNACVVCLKKHQVFKKTNMQEQYIRICPRKKHTKFWCGECRRYLCITEGSTCW